MSRNFVKLWLLERENSISWFRIITFYCTLQKSLLSNHVDMFFLNHKFYHFLPKKASKSHCLILFSSLRIQTAFENAMGITFKDKTLFRRKAQNGLKFNFPFSENFKGWIHLYKWSLQTKFTFSKKRFYFQGELVKKTETFEEELDCWK